MADIRNPPASEDLAGLQSAAMVVKTDPALRLWEIENEKLELLALRDEPDLTDEEKAAIDGQIRAYVELEVRKVHGVAGIMRYCDAFVDACKAEQRRLAQKRAMWEGRYGRIREMVLQVMQANGLKKIEAGTERFRIQKNAPALAVDVEMLEDKYLKAHVTINLADWKELLRCATSRGSTDFFLITPGSFTVTSEADNGAIKEALKQSIACPECKGAGDEIQQSMDEVGHIDQLHQACERCKGTGTVTASVPGAVMVQSEHLRLE